MPLHTLTADATRVVILSDSSPAWSHVAEVGTWCGEVTLHDCPEGGGRVILSYTPEDAERIGRALIAAAVVARV